jgi:hypothetical protein
MAASLHVTPSSAPSHHWLTPSSHTSSRGTKEAAAAPTALAPPAMVVGLRADFPLFRLRLLANEKEGVLLLPVVGWIG